MKRVCHRITFQFCVWVRLKENVSEIKIQKCHPGSANQFPQNFSLVSYYFQGHVPFSYSRLPLVTVTESFVKPAPGLQRFAGPDPKSGRDPHDHGHQVLDHEHGEVG